jgi:hypothetical protein
MPWAEALLDVSLRMGNVDAANIQLQMVQRLRELYFPATMDWFHPPQVSPAPSACAARSTTSTPIREGHS